MERRCCWKEQPERGTGKPLEKRRGSVGEEWRWKWEENYKKGGGDDEAFVGGFQLPQLCFHRLHFATVFFFSFLFFSQIF